MRTPTRTSPDQRVIDLTETGAAASRRVLVPQPRQSVDVDAVDSDTSLVARQLAFILRSE